jgi:carbamoyl-phosphate synthase large subunit
LNILLTSVGRRNYMVEYFKEALKPYNGKVYAMNSDLDASALWLADEYVKAPLIYDSTYKVILLDFCKTKNIQLVISLFDIELPVLSKLKSEFQDHGISIVVGDEWLTAMANDKWKTQEFLRQYEFETVSSYLSVDEFISDNEKGYSKYPVYVKPRWGMGSISVFKADDEEELRFFFKKVKKEIEQTYLKYESGSAPVHSVLIQEVLPGIEYGLDVINNLRGWYQTTIVKKKLAMRSGETDGAITVQEPMLMKIGEQLGTICKHPANMDVDVFFDGKKAYILEINPRFGGGYPFSHAAGVMLPEAIVKWYYGEQIEINQYLTPKIGVKAMKGIAIIKERINDKE